MSERSDEINQCYDENFPLHQATLHDIKFLELLIQCGAVTTVKTTTQLMTALHVLLLQGKKSAEDTLQTLKLLMDHGLRELINEPDSLGNTPLHALIVRYALEERRYGYHDDPQPWNKWDMLHIARYLLQNGAKPSINQARNSALACVLRHVTDWEFRYDLLNIFLVEGGDPNIEGRDGSVPLMVCLVPLINKDPLHHFSHLMKVCYLNCVKILCKYGANPNCCSKSNLTPLHVLVFTGTENISLARDEEKREAFEFIRNLLTLLLQHGLEPNVRFSQRSHHILLSLMDMVQNARSPKDLNFVSSLTLTLLQHGANPNMSCSAKARPSLSDPRRASRQTNHQVLFHYCQTLINKDQLLCDPDQNFVRYLNAAVFQLGLTSLHRLILLYYHSMQHRELYQCLKILTNQLSINPVRSCQTLYSVIKELST